MAESMIFNWMPGLGPAVVGESSFPNMDVKRTDLRTKLGMLASAGARGKSRWQPDRAVPPGCCSGRLIGMLVESS